MEVSNQLNKVESAVIRTLIYFDLFKYPLSAEEIHNHLSVQVSGFDEIEQALEDLVAQKHILQHGSHYSLQDKPELLERRKKGNSLAEKRMQKAYRNSRLIGKFPFVKGVMISGSLSKGYMEPDSDIDFFIIAEPGRLWIARTFLILYKKIILLNSHKNFCVNYFIDTNNLEIEDKNTFTATETVTLFPTLNPEIYADFRNANQWALEYFPNHPSRVGPNCAPLKPPFFRRTLEKVLAGSVGNRLDNWCMKRTLLRWKKKFPHFDDAQFNLALRTQKHVSKHHPSNFQQRVLKAIREKEEAFERQFNLNLT